MTSKIGQEIRHMFQAHSLPVVKSTWEVKLSSEDSQARLESEREEGAGCLLGMLNKPDASPATKGIYLEEIRQTAFSGTCRPL